MATETQLAPSATRENAFLKSVHEKHAAPLWTVLHQMVPAHPNPKATPTLWRYSEMRPSLMEAGEIVGAEEAERRVLMLVNPTMQPPYTTDTIYGGLQLVLPGETAPVHRHVAFALRFIIEGEDGFTAVEGQKIPMARGDVILTPPWNWHDHGNEGKGPMIWLDGLDLPLFRSLNSPLRFPWNEVRAALDSSSESYFIYHYKGEGRRHLSDTISAQAERVASGHTTSWHQETCSFIYHVASGEGSTKIKAPDGTEVEIKWTTRDTFAVPAWSQLQHNCTSGSEAYLFAINDRPLVESLGLFRQSA